MMNELTIGYYTSFDTPDEKPTWCARFKKAGITAYGSNQEIAVMNAIKMLEMRAVIRNKPIHGGGLPK